MGKGPELPDGRQLADEVNEWLKAGTRNREPIPLAQEQIDLLKKISNELSFSFIRNCFSGRYPGDLRPEETRVHNEFPVWKAGALRRIKESPISDKRQDYLTVMDTFSLSTVASYTDFAAEQAGREVGKADMGSEKEHEAKRNAEWWSKVDQITKGAAEKKD